jgi:hypothetical protein
MTTNQHGVADMNDKILTKKEAYLAMYAFLEDYYSRDKNDELANLLSDLSLLEDGGTADSAIEDDWNDALERVFQGKVDARLILTK